jgi:hypothetical protein
LPYSQSAWNRFSPKFAITDKWRDTVRFAFAAMTA